IELAPADILIAHVTAFDDPLIKVHLDECHAKKGWPSDLWIRKNPRWTRKLIQELKGHFMMQELRLFRPAGDDKRGSSSGDNIWRDTSLSLRISQLTRRIALYWPDLDSRVRAQVLAHFNVDENETPIRVSLR